MASTATHKPPVPVACRIGWSDSRVFTEADFTAMPGSTAGLTGSADRLAMPPFKTGDTGEQYLGVWVAGDPGIIDITQMNVSIGPSFPLADKHALSIAGVAGQYYPRSIQSGVLDVLLQVFTDQVGPALLDETQVESWARTDGGTIPLDRLPESVGGTGRTPAQLPIPNLSALFSLQTMRREMRAPDVANATRDAVIQSKFTAAAAWVTRESGVPLIDYTKTVYCPRPRGDDTPLVIDDTYVKEITAIKYWTADGTLVDDPDGTYVPGRLRAHALDHAVLWPNTQGWPTVLNRSDLEITYTRGTPTVEEGLRGAVVLIAYDLYQGAPEIKPTAAVFSLINPYRVYR